MKPSNLFHRSGAEVTQRFAESFSLCSSVRTLRLCGEILFILLFLTFSACHEAEIKPVDIAAEDVCTHCKMAISEKQFAAELITPDGDALKFDDIGCMQEYLKEKPDSKVAAHFFMNYETKTWLEGNAATFVKAKEITSPMGGGIIALENETKAKNAAAEFSGQILSFTELMKK